MTPPFDATPILRAVAARRHARLLAMDPAATQQALLLSLVWRAAATRFGRDHGFEGIRSVADFQRAVPLRRYEALHDDYLGAALPVLEDVLWPGRTPYLALSSGTTSGRTKHIPVTREMVRANRDTALDVLVWHLAAHPRARPFGGLSFILGGSTDLTQVAPGVLAGDLSGIAAVEVPWFLRRWAWPPERIALMPDWDAKLAALAAEAPARDIRTLSGTPSWLLVLLERLAARHGVPPLPSLELLIHGGVAWAPYRDRLAPFLPPGCTTREVYPASEGFVAIADRGEGEGMRLNLDRGCFFEFVPVGELDAPNPTRHWAATLETGVEYAVVVSSCAGLFGYVLGDTVRFVDRAPPRLLVTGRTSWTLSAFGEHLAGEEIEAALLHAAAEAGIAVAEYVVGPEFLGSAGRHRWCVEAQGSCDPARLAALLDAALRAENDDYAAHRDGAQLAAPEVVLVRPGAFACWMRAQGKMGGQHKVPRVVADPERFAAMAAALSAEPPASRG
ncbi:GH3 family domain-containing protein [Roseomonas rosulenta]|uniref:GH3 family domain-containing protein n=1 Tax=Roseomonas rosulenta TaxID=2748667 RepID=UPI0018E05EE2|nr:GH3 auxin-responsive promoter family protein [Roseomonas rosulenta]